MAASQPSVPMQQDPSSLQRNVFVRILEEPASKALRFRYECEGRSAGSLPGASSTQDKKSFPKIQVVGYRGRAVVVVSCVTIDPPYRAHPHNLVGKEGCKKGVCTMEIANDEMTCEFSNLGIQCVKKKDIEDSLRVREEIRVDPFRTGFNHKSQPGSIDLNSVRLCFQVFCEGPERGQFKVPLKPVVSEAIYDKKAINDLTIMKLSDCTSPVMGNKEIILLCDKVSKDDIEVRFYEENEETGAVVWESFGDFQPSDVHKQYAISFRTPQYHNLEITSPARVFIQLRCPSKDTTSAARPFQYIPLLTSGSCKRKWNLLSFSGTYSSYMTPNGGTSNEEPCKKIKSVVELEDILAGDQASADTDPPIYDRLNEFMMMGKDEQDEMGGQGSFLVGGNPEVENVYDVDLELISQIIKTQEANDIGGSDLFADMIIEDDVVNGNGGGGGGDLELKVMNVILAPQNLESAPPQMVIPNTTPTPPTRPPKRIVSPPAPPPPESTTAPPLPPKKGSPATTPTKTKNPATFLKNLFSPTKKNKKANANANVNTNVATQQVGSVQDKPPPVPSVPPPSLLADNVSTTTSEHTLVGNYELTEQLGLYVDNDAPLATANTDLKRKRLKHENSKTLSQYFENNKRPRQNSYPPVNSPPTPQQLPQTQTPPPQQPPQLMSPMSNPQLMSPHPPQLMSPQPPQQLMYNPPLQQPIQLPSLQNLPPPPPHPNPPIYIKQEPQYTPNPNQYYYDLMMNTRPPSQHQLPQQQAPITYSGGGIVNREGDTNANEDDTNLNSDFSLPHLSDVNLSLLDQHLSENLNDMNLNNF